MGIGAIAIQTGQKKEVPGPPFNITSAANGLSIDAVTGKIVLGNDVGGTAAQLLNNREIPMSSFNVGFRGRGRFGIGTGNPLSVSRFIIDLSGLESGNPITAFGNGVVDQNFSNSLIAKDYGTNPGGIENDLTLLTTGNSSAAIRSQIELTKARGTIPVPLVVQNGDSLGTINGGGYDGASMMLRAAINFNVDAVPAVGSMPIAIIFRTGPSISLERMRIASNGNIGISTSTPTAQLHIAAGTTTANTAPLKLTAGNNLTVAEDGAFEYDGTNLFFTRTAATRETAFVGSSGAAAPGTTAGIVITNFYGTSATNYLGDPNNWASVVIAGTAFKIPLYT